MKVRCGFVSNSSSSSFVVMIRDPLAVDTDLIIAKEQIKKLIKYGFKIFNNIYPQNVTYGDYIKGNLVQSLKEVKETDVSLAYHIDCNQDEVICFLIKNKIPFKASVHYQQYYYAYVENSNYLYKIPNLGNIACMYGLDELKDKRNAEVEKISIKKFLKEN